ncbi:hypothetical protein SIM91_19470 [Rhodococcus opacus]|uniref:DUF6745 domain-containing protein n=1 Tax=Rhodococcus opacus TaxID=37919 RepID=UPI0002A282E4|nr:hypothetical protein [Rhodococcus opacus]ELB94049.1 hypothetical protein Rwratislav_06160 [Rhodococcus wratislaviensis IFP 2016]MDX5965427.1 hypothetical protein [Rhodococcus opacus]NKY75618.1 hypothetical protein [Rhodococcus opacus]CAG7579976.1 hypothetical protein E143388_00122 [Rhodococcus opacus]
MSAAPFRSAARPRAAFTENADPLSDYILVVEAVRDAWLTHGLCAHPSDRTTAESAVAQLYRQSKSREPEFVWVPSPSAGSSLIAAEGLAMPMSLEGNGIRGATAGIATMLSESRKRMDARIKRRISDWPNERRAVETARVKPPADAARVGISPDRIIRATVWDSLHITLFDGVAAAIRTLLPPAVLGVTWYGQQEAHRVAYYDTYRRLGLANFHSHDDALLDANIALTGATGWWWAFDGVCVMAERPTTLHSEPIPGRVHNEHRLHHSDSPALEFQDGDAVFVLHGTVVPDWVVRDPTAERIARERNVEIRRCAIERIGWDNYIDTADLALVDQADDPGNAGCTLRLYATPDGWGRTGRILLAINGSPERDGRRRQYGLHVPTWISSALDAAGWTYGLGGADYARLVRRT